MIGNLIKNKILFWLGMVHLLVFVFLCGYSIFNETMILGLNSAIKPMKFALSIWVYSWTMAIILNYVNDNHKVTVYSWVAVVCMSFEQIAITSQALRGELSHFNISSIYGIVLFALMGVFILIITLWTGYITYVFIKQKSYNLPPAIVFSIKIGLIYFVIFSLFGGYISGLKGHTVGSDDSGEGLFFINWSTKFGDLRVAHFFGIHSLQIIPLFALIITAFFDVIKSIKIVQLFSLIYLIFVIFMLVQGILGVPFMR